jgi:hypothetical protein
MTLRTLVGLLLGRDENVKDEPYNGKILGSLLELVDGSIDGCKLGSLDGFSLGLFDS